jgi:hypothetical protein
LPIKILLFCSAEMLNDLDSPTGRSGLACLGVF